MSDDTSEALGEEFREIAATAPDTKVAPAQGIAAIALSMALKYHDINHVHDGALYQQYKLEGRNIAPLHLDWVLETATRFEAWLLGASDRIQKIIVEALEVVIEDEAGSVDTPEPTPDGAPSEPEQE